MLYLYALVAQIHGLITAVLLFKGFTGWLAPKPAKPGQDSQSPQTLARFYTYAVGNMISLLWAVAVFEVLRYLANSYGWVHNYLWVQ